MRRSSRSDWTSQASVRNRRQPIASFREKYQLPFTLLSDADKFVIRMYDVLGPLGFGVRRATYLIDQARYIRSAVLADFRISQHSEFIRRAVALSTGAARPA